MVDRLLTLTFAVLAIAIKIRIVGDLYPPATGSEVSSSDGRTELTTSEETAPEAAV